MIYGQSKEKSGMSAKLQCVRFVVVDSQFFTVVWLFFFFFPLFFLLSLLLSFRFQSPSGKMEYAMSSGACGTQRQYPF